LPNDTSLIDKELSNIDDDGDLKILLLMKGEPSLRIIENNFLDHSQGLVAAAGLDFQDNSGTVSFTTGQSTAAINLTIVDDLDLEHDEYYYLEFSYDTENGTIV
jgi:hypothetical protein